ncbi:hypothetical protein V8G54_024919 [Vigna mungo]|uniref:Uncharacterized protein n=1 Tax=Vigna mungo TaxID=3915 RepID=A0AAQ3RT22_VIGMU
MDLHKNKTKKETKIKLIKGNITRGTGEINKYQQRYGESIFFLGGIMDVHIVISFSKSKTQKILNMKYIRICSIHICKRIRNPLKSYVHIKNRGEKKKTEITLTQKSNQAPR